MATRLPYTLTLSRYADFMKLEADLRTLLQCQSQQCAFLQSAAYVDLKLQMIHALNLQRQQHDDEANDNNNTITTIHIPGSTLVMYVSPHLLQVLIQCRPPLVLATPTNNETPPLQGDEEEEEPRKRKRDPDDTQQQQQLTSALLTMKQRR